MKNYDEVLGGIVEEILKNNREFQKRRDLIRADELLSDKGKSESLTKLFQQYSKKHKELRDKLEQERAKIKRALSRAVYSPNSKDMQAFNAALDRLDNIKHEDELSRLISRADKTGDKVTLQAAVLFAAEKGYTNAMNRVMELLPSEAEALERLSDFQTRWGDARSAGTRFEERIYTTGPQKPEEVPRSIIGEAE